jgi:hypothetical protein
LLGVANAGADLSVSVVIPAYRRTYLRQAIASVLAQGYEDFELIIGDDNPGDEVVQVVDQFRDPRIRYMRTIGNAGAVENSRMLWDTASRPLLKYLFDDDLLMPNALIEMVGALQTHPHASFCFSNRFIIDADGRVINEPKSTPDGRVGLVTAGDVLTALIPNVHNPIGEFSNVLINKGSGVEFGDLLRYGEFEIEIIGDVAFYLNATRKAPAVQIGKTLAAFRRHADQNSSPAYNPRFALALFEWEIMLRWEHDAGRLTREQVLAACDKLDRAYTSWLPQLPELKHVHPELLAFRSALKRGEAKAVTPEFRAGLAVITKVTEEKWFADRQRRAEGASGERRLQPS